MSVTIHESSPSSKFLSFSADPLPNPTQATSPQPEGVTALSRHCTLSFMLHDGEYHEVRSASSKGTLASCTSRESLDERRKSIMNRINSYHSGRRRGMRGSGGTPSEALIEHRLQQWRQIEEDALQSKPRTDIPESNLVTNYIRSQKMPHQTHSSILELDSTDCSHSLHVHSNFMSPPSDLSSKGISPTSNGSISPISQYFTGATRPGTPTGINFSHKHSPIQQSETNSPAPQQQKPQCFIFPDLPTAQTLMSSMDRDLSYVTPTSPLSLECSRNRSKISVPDMDPIMEEDSEASSRVLSTVEVFTELNESGMKQLNTTAAQTIVYIPEASKVERTRTLVAHSSTQSRYDDNINKAIITVTVQACHNFYKHCTKPCNQYA